MTGAYLRVKQGDRFENVEVEHLTDAERFEIFSNRQPDEIIRWLNLVCHELARIDAGQP